MKRFFNPFAILWLFVMLAPTAPLRAQADFTVTTYSGLPAYAGASDGFPQSEARFGSLAGMSVTADGVVYFTENNVFWGVRRIGLDGRVTTVAGGLTGYVDGVGAAARFENPRSIAVGPDGTLWIGDVSNQRIRKMSPEAAVTTFNRTSTDDGPIKIYASAEFFAFGVDGTFYVSDPASHAVYEISRNGVEDRLVGDAGEGSRDGSVSVAQMRMPRGLARDASGNGFVVDGGNHTIRKISPTGVVSTFAGSAGQMGYMDGSGAAARFNDPCGLAIDSEGNLYVADRGNHVIRKVTPTGVVTTWVGIAGQSGDSDGVGATGTGTRATLNSPYHLAIDGQNNLYFTQSGLRSIRKVSPDGRVLSLVTYTPSMTGAVDGPGTPATYTSPIAIAVDPKGNVYVGGSDRLVRKISPSGEAVSLAGQPYVSAVVDDVSDAARLGLPRGFAVDGRGHLLFVEATYGLIREVTPAGRVQTLTGSEVGQKDGTLVSALFRRPSSLAIDASGNLYVADFDAHVIRRISPDGRVVTWAGKADSPGTEDGKGSAARLYQPRAVAADSAGNVYVAQSNHVIRKISAQAEVVTWVGTPDAAGAADGSAAAARFNVPMALAVDQSGHVYVGELNNYGLRRISPTGVVTTVAGNLSNATHADGVGGAARFTRISALAIGYDGYLYVTDERSHTVRRVKLPAGSQPAVTPPDTSVPLTGPGYGRPINLSVRGPAGSDEATLIAGFVVAGSGSKQILLRVSGPALAQFGLSGVGDPVAKLYRGDSLVMENDNWASGLGGLFKRVGAFAWEPGSRDAAILVDLEPGNYTLHAVNRGPLREALIEVYDVSQEESSRLENVSCRLVEDTQAPLIVGITLDKAVPVLVRNGGPSLAQFDLTTMAPDTRLTLFQGEQVLATNDDWPTNLIPEFKRLGAFDYISAKDSAIKLDQPPLQLTAHAWAVGRSGVGIVEVYNAK